jgi:hypothetical protein
MPRSAIFSGAFFLDVMSLRLAGTVSAPAFLLVGCQILRRKGRTARLLLWCRFGCAELRQIANVKSATLISPESFSSGRPRS